MLAFTPITIDDGEVQLSSDYCVKGDTMQITWGGSLIHVGADECRWRAPGLLCP